MVKPSVRAFLAEKLSNSEHSFLFNKRLAAVLAVENRDRYAPFSLTRDTPVFSVANHRGNSVLTPGRDPLNSVDSVNGLVLEVVNRAEPLVCRSEKNGRFTSPAMRILVDNLFKSKQIAVIIKLDGDFLVCLVGGKTCELSCFLGENAVAVNRADYGNLGVITANVVVVNTVTGSGMNAACTAFESYVVTDNKQRLTVKERMLSFHILKLTALDSRNNGVVGNSGFFHCGFIQIGSHYVVLVAVLNNGVLIARTHADCYVCRKSPCGGCPDYKEHLRRVNAHSGKLAEVIGNLEFYVN